MVDPRDKKIGYKMNPGSKEKDTLTSFSEPQYKMLKDKLIMRATGDTSISAVTGNRVNVKKSLATFDKTYGEDTGAKVKAVQDMVSGFTVRGKREIKGGMGLFAHLFN